MLTIYYNEEQKSPASAVISVNDDWVSAEVTDTANSLYGYDTITSLRAYSSYTLSLKKEGYTKIYRQINSSDYQFLDMNVLGTAIKMGFAKISQLYAMKDAIQVDTGIISTAKKDIVIRVFVSDKDHITVKTDLGYKLLPFKPSELVTEDHPRFHLWDSYEIEVAGQKIRANRKGIVKAGDPTIPITIPEGQDYIEFKIHKVLGEFDGDYLTRDFDDDEVTVESSCGLVNNRRVPLVKGEGSFRLYPFGHTGVFHLKLGRKWYTVWNDYSLILG